VCDSTHKVGEATSVTQSIARDIAGINVTSDELRQGSQQVHMSAQALGEQLEKLTGLARAFKTTRHDIDFAGIRRAHSAWKGRFIELFAGRRKLGTSEITSHRDCALGQWYHGDLDASIKQHPEFAELGRQHEAFHEQALTVAKEWNAGRKSEARAAFTHLMELTRTLFGLLDRLEADIAADEKAA